MSDGEGRRVISPTEFVLLVKVYHEIASEPWFTMDDAQRYQFRRYVITKFREGMTETDDLMTHCFEIARTQFSAE